MTKSDDYLWDQSGEVDPEVARLESLLSPLRHEAPLDELRLRRRRSRLPLLLGLAVAVAAVLAVVVWWPGGEPPQLTCAGTTGFKFVAHGGKVACGGSTMERGELAIGKLLDTGAYEAELAIANIGSAQLGARTRVRLDRTNKDGHELFLEQGRMHARVNAPPRLFAVATPSAQVTDLGCEYTLEIEPSGAGSIHVITGKVELETGTGTIVVAPAGTRARLLRGRRASVPVSDRASHQLVAYVHELEAGSAGALKRVLAIATAADAITVANLVAIVPVAQKRIVLERLAELVPPPQSLTIDEALDDRILFEMWFDEVVLVHAGA